MVPKRRAIGYSKPYPKYDLIPLPPKYRLPEFSKFSGSDGSSSIEHELNGKPYCKWHNTFSHTTNDCRVWRQQIQMAIEQGRLIFNQYAMKVDTHPFPAVNTVEYAYPEGCQPGFSLSINMVEPGHHSEQQQAFDEIKRYLTTPPVLVPPQQDRPFYIYLSVADTSIASVVVQLYEGVEKVVFYLSRRMLDAETRYPEVEKLCLCLFFTCTKLHHILLTAEIIVICNLQAKGQALADLIAERINTNIAALSIRAWAMFFDGSACDDGCGIGILLVSPRGQHTPSPSDYLLLAQTMLEYEAVRKGLELLLEAGAEAVELFGDSKLVIYQLTDEYKCESESLFPYWMECRELMTHFRYINFNWVPRSQNTDANDLAQMASGYKDIPDGSEVQVQFLEQDDWRANIFNYLKDSLGST
ncbi:hypothetical protein QYE76_025526 [Lolium multiflorum]|uniref:RNase H type-1 domain-containing protein n=1 Tax=Lolium multiflorum TaxID=4521 RepID=A0AAD8RI26_LOLMU|nr:hypothetical protein QYE76_025526 [Lolium multiflorum]